MFSKRRKGFATGEGEANERGMGGWKTGSLQKSSGVTQSRWLRGKDRKKGRDFANELERKRDEDDIEREIATQRSAVDSCIWNVWSRAFELSWESHILAS